MAVWLFRITSALVLAVSLLASRPVLGQNPDISLPSDFDTWSDSIKIQSLQDSADSYSMYSQSSIMYQLLMIDELNRMQNFEALANKSQYLSTIFANRGFHTKAREYAYISLENARLAGKKEDVVWALFRLSSSEMDVGNFDQALEYGNDALQLSLALDADDPKDSLNRSELIAWSHCMIGEVYRTNGDNQKALEQYYDGLAASPVVDSLDGGTKPTLNHNIGITLVALGSLEEGMAKLNEPRTLETDEAEGISSTYFERQEAHIKVARGKGKPGEAIDIANKCLQESREVGFPNWELRLLDILADIHAQQGKFEETIGYQKTARKLEKETNGQIVQQQLAFLEMDQRYAELRSQNELLQARNDNQAQWFWAMLIIGILVIMLLFGLWIIIIRTKGSNAKLKSKNDSLDELIHEKEMWMNLMAHDLKAPLNSIEGLVNLARDDDMPTEVRTSSLDRIYNAVSRGTELIDHLLEISRLERGDFSIERSSFKPYQTLVDLNNDFTPLAAQKNISISVVDSNKDLSIHSDEALVRRIVENFLGNALKYSPRDTAVKVGINSTKTEVSLYVQDQGPGLSQEDQANLFKKFVRLTPQPTGGESSTGLGLAIVKAISEKLGGTIEVQSEEGKGSTFSLVLKKS